MNFEDLQKAWHTQEPAPRLTIHPDLLLKEVRRNKEQFERLLFWRDVREAGICFLLAPVFFYTGLKHRDWQWCLPGLACLGVGLFLLVDRRRQRGKQPSTSDPLRACIEASLIQVRHQIWLLKNVLWWYLLPLGAGIEVIFLSAAWKSRNVTSLVWAIVLIALYWGIHRLNQYAVRTGLEPRRRELEDLLASLEK